MTYPPSKLHRLSIGVAKPILLAPGEQAKVQSLLFEPLKSEPRLLRVYDRETTLTVDAPIVNRARQ